jgi:hypothetical protein
MDSDFAFIDRALQSTDRIQVKHALQQVRLEVAELSQIKKLAAEEIAVIRSDYASRVAEQRSNTDGASIGAFARAFQTARGNPDRKAVDATIRAYIAQTEQADALMRTADEAILQLQRRLMDIGPG